VIVRVTGLRVGDSIDISEEWIRGPFPIPLSMSEWIWMCVCLISKPILVAPFQRLTLDGWMDANPRDFRGTVNI